MRSPARLCQWTFASDCSLENNWVHPPYALLGRVIGHFLHSDAQATLIAPKCPSAYWWPLIAPQLMTSRYLELGSCAEVFTYHSDLPLPDHLLPRGQLFAIRFTRT